MARSDRMAAPPYYTGAHDVDTNSRASVCRIFSEPTPSVTWKRQTGSNPAMRSICN